MGSELKVSDQFSARHVTAADRLAGTGGKAVTLKKTLRIKEELIHGLLFLCGMLSILTTIGIVVVLGTEALRFFSTTEWLNTNKGIAVATTAEDTIIGLNTRGSQITEGNIIRIGDEIMRVTGVTLEEDVIYVEVERGLRNTEVVPHAVGATVFNGAEVSLVKFLTQTKWAPQIGSFGILPLLNSTLMVSGIAMIVSIPLGLGAAIYLSEYASPRARSILKPVLEILAGVPTVVYGYFALTFMTPLLRTLLGVDTVDVYNVASAGIVVGIMIIPTISSISEDALSAVPRSLRDASYGLGATRLETIFRVLIPAALSGIVAAFILGVSRAVGETMIVLIAAGAGPNLTSNPFKAAETMAGHIARISTGDLSFGSIDYNSVFAIGLTLFLMTMVLNLISTFITRRFREVYS